jgi:hypothetical protein
MASSIDPDVFAPITDQFKRVEAQTGRSRYRVFEEWLEFVVTTLARDDDTYADLVIDLEQATEDESAARECVDAYAGAFGLLVDAMADVTVPGTDTPADLLGAMYEAYGAASDQFGQHFTPESVATAKAKLAFPDADSVRDATPEDPLVIGDPACGSGRLPFQAVHHLRDVAPETPVVVVARDIDATCARMATINFALWGIPAYVVHGNSLTLDTWQVWRVDTPTQPLTRPSQDGVVTTVPPEDAPVRTSPDVEHQPQETNSDASPSPADGLTVDDAAKVSLGDFS